MKEIRDAFVLENQGQKIFGILHLPSQNVNCPIVIILHGYASTKVGVHRCYLKLAMKLLEKGIGCCRFDFRGCGDSEGETSSMTIEDFFSDVECVITFLRKKGFEKIALFGSSLGGSIAILTATRLPIKALALWAPVASGILWFQDWLARHPQNLSHISSYQGVEISENFKREFSKFHADQLLKGLTEIPVLHLQGNQDEIVSLKHAQAFEKARIGASSESKFIQYPEKEHQLGKTTILAEALEEICLWFKKNIGE